MSEIKDYLKQMIMISNKYNFANKDGFLYSGVYDFMLKEGTEFNATKALFTEEGEIKECYYNTYLLCCKNHEYTYTEGYIMTLGICTSHAWATNEDGQIIDPTLRGARNNRVNEYFGVRFNMNYVINLAESQLSCGSVIDNYMDTFPIITGEHTKEEWKY